LHSLAAPSRRFNYTELRRRDAGEGTGALEVTLTATHGTLQLGSPTGVTLEAGGGSVGSEVNARPPGRCIVDRRRHGDAHPPCRPPRMKGARRTVSARSRIRI